MDFKTVREFHWLTKIVILLTGLVFAIYLTAIVAHLLGLSHVSQGLGMMLFSMVTILTQLFFPIVLVIIAICIVATRIKVWIEKYLDAMLAKLDALLENKSTDEDSGAKLAVMSSRIEEIEKKVDKISDILEKVAD